MQKGGGWDPHTWISKTFGPSNSNMSVPRTFRVEFVSPAQYKFIKFIECKVHVRTVVRTTCKNFILVKIREYEWVYHPIVIFCHILLQDHAGHQTPWSCEKCTSPRDDKHPAYHQHCTRLSNGWRCRPINICIVGLMLCYWHVLILHDEVDKIFCTILSLADNINV